MTYQDLKTEDIEYIEGLITAKNRNMRVDGHKVTNFVNRLLGKNYRLTNCSSCIRQRINEMERWFNRQREEWEKQHPVEEPKVEEPEIKVENETIEPEKEVETKVEAVVEEPEKEVEEVKTETKKKAPAKKKSTGRKKKKES